MENQAGPRINLSTLEMIALLWQQALVRPTLAGWFSLADYLENLTADEEGVTSQMGILVYADLLELRNKAWMNYLTLFPMDGETEH